jgi:regulator of protease activity HflC (stomatin/prohibitin superfamily)
MISVLLILAMLGLFVYGVIKTLGFRVDPTSRTGRNFLWHLNFSGVPYFFGALLIFVLLASWTTIESGNVGVVKRWGRATRQLNPGPHLIVPFAETVDTVTVQTRIIKPNETASSKDLQNVHTEVTLAYHVDPMYALYILVQLNNDAETRVINPAIVEAVKAETAQYVASDLITMRTKVRDGIEERIKRRIEAEHIIAETVSITDFNFSAEYNSAIEAKVTAEQHAEKAENDLKRIQIEAQQQVAQAKGEAEALKAQKEQITPELLQLRTVEMMREKWDGHLPENYVTTTGLPMLDVLSGKKKSQ